MSIVDNIVRGAVEGVVGESVGKRAPFLDRPDAQLERPTPGSPMPAPRFPLPARRDDSTTGTAPAADMSEGEGGSTGRGYSFSQSLAPGGLNFSTIQPQSSMQVSDIVKESKTMGGEFAGSIAGFKPYYNPATGRISTGAPNLGTFGLPFSFLASGVGSFIREKQQEAAINAARGFSNNGVVSLNGQTVAVVDGKIYGNLPSDYAGGYHNLKKEIFFVTTSHL